MFSLREIVKKSKIRVKWSFRNENKIVETKNSVNLVINDTGFSTNSNLMCVYTYTYMCANMQYFDKDKEK